MPEPIESAGSESRGGRWITPRRVTVACSLFVVIVILGRWWTSRLLIRDIDAAGGTWGPYFTSDFEQGVTNLFNSKLLPDSRLQWVYLGGRRFDDPWLPRFAGLPHLGHFHFIETSFTDAGIQSLKQVPKVESLRLDACSRLTDDCLTPISELSDLFHLELCDINVTDVGVAHLSRLSKLEHLDLRGTGITNAGLMHLAKLPNLKRLYLNRTAVTDGGLVHLAGSPSLMEVRLHGTRVTQDGVDELQRALPGCSITFVGPDSSERTWKP